MAADLKPFACVLISVFIFFLIVHPAAAQTSPPPAKPPSPSPALPPDGSPISHTSNASGPSPLPSGAPPNPDSPPSPPAPSPNSVPSPAPSPASSSISNPPGSSPPDTPPPSPGGSIDIDSPPPAKSPSALGKVGDRGQPAAEAAEAKDHGNGGLNAGKKAGIAVGVLVAGAVVFGAWLVYRKRQENIRRSQYRYSARAEFL